MTAIDLFALPKISFRLLYGSSIAALGRRKIPQLGVIGGVYVVLPWRPLHNLHRPTVPVRRLADVRERSSSRTPHDRIDRK
jgi:hypothetical protein